MEHAVSPTPANAFFTYCNKLFDILSGLSAFAMFVVVIIQIAGRLSGHPAPWTEESTRFIFVWMVFLGIGIGFRKAESARITIFLNWLPKFFNQLAFYVYIMGSIGFFIFMFYTGIQIVWQQVSMHEMGSALMIPMWIVGLSIPVSAALGILGVIESAVYHKKLI
jgi:C4-dicarboxylate transporter DctQ subunit